MTESTRNGPTELLPNLGAEEGDDWRGMQTQPAVRVAASLWCLLFGHEAKLWLPPTDPDAAWTTRPREALWPDALGPATTPAALRPAFRWIEESRSEIAVWFPTANAAKLARIHGAASLPGPSPESVRQVHDKAFAVEASQSLGLLQRALARCIEVLDASELGDADTLLARLDLQLASWPESTGGRFTLKPRFGSSGRGRVGGRETVDTPAIRGALPRLATRGGAIFEPWLDRVQDFSVSLLIPPAESEADLPVILGSLEMWNTPSGVYRGHCGEVDARGRVFSGDREDESLRAEAAGVASLARTRGFEGPCGVDSFRYRETQASPADERLRETQASPADERLRMRGAVEFNARPTMGLVTIGLVRRALPLVREGLGLTPGKRLGFALVYRDPDDADWEPRVRDALGAETPILELAPTIEADTASPVLVFAETLEKLRRERSLLFGS